jgi:hypothetical protein
MRLGPSTGVRSVTSCKSASAILRRSVRRSSSAKWILALVEDAFDDPRIEAAHSSGGIPHISALILPPSLMDGAPEMERTGSRRCCCRKPGQETLEDRATTFRCTHAGNSNPAALASRSHSTSFANEAASTSAKPWISNRSPSGSNHGPHTEWSPYERSAEQRCHRKQAGECTERSGSFKSKDPVPDARN